MISLKDRGTKQIVRKKNQEKKTEKQEAGNEGEKKEMKEILRKLNQKQSIK